MSEKIETEPLLIAPAGACYPRLVQLGFGGCALVFSEEEEHKVRRSNTRAVLFTVSICLCIAASVLLWAFVSLFVHQVK